jgi:formylglycine-generating enzyme required for sulfatase activity
MDDLKNDSRSLRLYVKKTFGEIKLLLLVDQFEETFTLCKDQAERKAFIENLSSLTSDEGTARVVITLRADFYHHCAEYEGLRQTLQIHQAYIGAMTADELRQAITTPAETNGWYFQPGLVDLILQDVGTEPGALPLLSHALLETWKRRQGRTMTLQGYHEAGGVKKAIAQTAESVYDRLTPAEQLIARGIFLRLIELSENTQDTRRRVKMDELSFAVETQDSVLKVLKILTDARLITTEQDSAEVSHEALIREWGTLRRWLDEDREGLRLHYHLTESAHEWQSRGRESSELYRGARLKQIQNWAKDHGGLLSLLEEEFLSASQNMQNRERLQWAILACVVVTLLLAITLAQTGYINRFIYKPIDMENYWVTIPAGEFQMGSTYKEIAEGEGTCQICDAMDEKPRHLVSLDTYQIGKYEITIRQYTQCVRAGVCTGTYDIGDDKETYPAINVNWDDAMTFCAWVGGRLPTEAEWEKAARGVDGRIYPWEGDPSAELLNYRNNNGGIVEIGSYPNGVSPYGIFDLAGNVWEWVYDWYSESYYSDSPKENPTGPETGIYRVLRGGSWNDGDSVVRSANRHFQYPSNSNGFIGFRCARDLP